MFANAGMQKATEHLSMGGRQAILLPGPALRTYKLCSHKGPDAREGSVLSRKGLALGLMLCSSQEPQSSSSSLPTSS